MAILYTQVLISDPCTVISPEGFQPDFRYHRHGFNAFYHINININRGRPFHAIRLFCRNETMWDMHGREELSECVGRNPRRHWCRLLITMWKRLLI